MKPNILFYPGAARLGNIITAFELAKALSTYSHRRIYFFEDDLPKNILQEIRASFQTISGRAFDSELAKHKIGTVIIGKDNKHLPYFKEQKDISTILLLTVHPSIERQFHNLRHVIDQIDGVMINGFNGISPMTKEIHDFDDKIIFIGPIRSFPRFETSKSDSIFCYFDGQYALDPLYTVLELFSFIHKHYDLSVHLHVFSLHEKDNVKLRHEIGRMPYIRFSSGFIPREHLLRELAASRLAIIGAGLGLIFETLVYRIPLIVIPCNKKNGEKTFEQYKNADFLKSKNSAIVFEQNYSFYDLLNATLAMLENESVSRNHVQAGNDLINRKSIHEAAKKVIKFISVST